MLNKRTLKDQTALILAVGRDHVDCVEALLERGADTEVMNQNRETALYKGGCHTALHTALHTAFTKPKAKSLYCC